MRCFSRLLLAGSIVFFIPIGACDSDSTTPAASGTDVDEVPTENTEAYAAYLRALDTLHNEGLFNNRRAVEQLEEAVEADPTFALAWARLSEARSRMSRALDDQNTREAALSALAEAPGVPIRED